MVDAPHGHATEQHLKELQLKIGANYGSATFGVGAGTPPLSFHVKISKKRDRPELRNALSMPFL